MIYKESHLPKGEWLFVFLSGVILSYVEVWCRGLCPHVSSVSNITAYAQNKKVESKKLLLQTLNTRPNVASRFREALSMPQH